MRKGLILLLTIILVCFGVGFSLSFFKYDAAIRTNTQLIVSQANDFEEHIVVKMSITSMEEAQENNDLTKLISLKGKVFSINEQYNSTNIFVRGFLGKHYLDKLLEAGDQIHQVEQAIGEL